jgi:hypothetical protein
MLTIHRYTYWTKHPYAAATGPCDPALVTRWHVKRDGRTVVRCPTEATARSIVEYLLGRPATAA